MPVSIRSNAAFGLTGYAFAYAQSSQQTTSATGGSTETMAGADNAGMSSPTFTGGGSGTVSAQDVQSSNSSLSQQGSFAGGSFNLSAVSYAGAASDSYSNSATDASAWTGADSGSASDASADSGSSAQTVSASGSFVGGSWSLSSYVLAGSSQAANSDSSDQQQTLSLGSFGGTSNSSFANSDASADSSSLYQAGTQAAGAYANGSYNYHDGSASTATANAQGPAQGPNLAMGQTWTQQSANVVVLGGTQQQTASATYSYQDPGGSGTATNNGSAASAAVATTPVVQFGAPDPSVVAAAGVAQLVGTPAGGATAIAQPAAGSTAPGATAPVPISVNLQVVPATAAWMNTTLQTSQQVTNTSTYQQTLNGQSGGAQQAVGNNNDGVVSADQAALNGVRQKANGASFGVTAWNTVVAPALKTAQWVQGGGIVSSFVAILSLDDPGGGLAANYNRAPNFVSSSNDPLVQEVDSMLNNNGQPLTAGSAPLYGTYWDGQGHSAGEALSMAAPFVEAGIFIVAGAWIMGPAALIGVAGPAIGAAMSAGPGLAVNLLGGADPGTIASGFGRDMFEGAVMGGIGSIAGGAQSARAPARGSFLNAGSGAGMNSQRSNSGAQENPRSFDQRFSGNSACFAGDMELLTRRGNVRFDALTKADEVASCDENRPDGAVEFKQVAEIFETTGCIWHVHVRGEVIRTTAEHPFYVWAKGWVHAWQLQPGDRLRSHDGRMVAVEEVFDTAVEERVYNCAVEDFHTYFVGADGWGFSVWAHNACNEIIPRKSSKTIRSEWEAANGRPWPKDPVTGRNQDVSHVIPLGDGGTNGLSNIEPLPHPDHVQLHVDNGDFRRWGARRY